MISLVLPHVKAPNMAMVTHDWAEPSSKSTTDFGVEEGHPFENGSVILLGLSEKSGCALLASDC